MTYADSQLKRDDRIELTHPIAGIAVGTRGTILRRFMFDPLYDVCFDGYAVPRLVHKRDLAPAPPLGLRLADREPVEGEESLQPGDMVLLYSDGLTEARRPDGELFTEQRLAEFIERQAANGLPAPETLRGLRDAIIERGEGALRDDATALLLEWRRDTQAALLPRTVL